MQQALHCARSSHSGVLVQQVFQVHPVAHCLFPLLHQKALLFFRCSTVRTKKCCCSRHSALQPLKLGTLRESVPSWGLWTLVSRKCRSPGLALPVTVHACAAGMEYQCQCGDGKMTDPANRFKCIEAVRFACHLWLHHPKRCSHRPC